MNRRENKPDDPEGPLKHLFKKAGDSVGRGLDTIRGTKRNRDVRPGTASSGSEYSPGNQRPYKKTDPGEGPSFTGKGKGRAVITPPNPAPTALPAPINTTFLTPTFNLRNPRNTGPIDERQHMELAVSRANATAIRIGRHVSELTDIRTLLEKAAQDESGDEYHVEQLQGLLTMFNDWSFEHDNHVGQLKERMEDLVEKTDTYATSKVPTGGKTVAFEDVFRSARATGETTTDLPAPGSTFIPQDADSDSEEDEAFEAIDVDQGLRNAKLPPNIPTSDAVIPSSQQFVPPPSTQPIQQIVQKFPQKVNTSEYVFSVIWPLFEKLHATRPNHPIFRDALVLGEVTAPFKDSGKLGNNAWKPSWWGKVQDLSHAVAKIMGREMIAGSCWMVKTGEGSFQTKVPKKKLCYWSWVRLLAFVTIPTDRNWQLVTAETTNKSGQKHSDSPFAHYCHNGHYSQINPKKDAGCVNGVQHGHFASILFNNQQKACKTLEASKCPGHDWDVGEVGIVRMQRRRCIYVRRSLVKKGVLMPCLNEPRKPFGTEKCGCETKCEKDTVVEASSDDSSDFGQGIVVAEPSSEI